MKTRIDLTVILQRPAVLTAADRTQMLDLMRTYYENVCPSAFQRDLDAKDWIICMHVPAEQRIVGFSTQVLWTQEDSGHEARILFSGDTIVAREFRHTSHLARAWGRFALQIVAQRPGVPHYWLLLSKGYRTYRFLPLFFREYYPRPESPFPARLRSLRDSLVDRLYGHAYDRQTGILRGPLINNYRVRAVVGDVPAGRLRDPHVAFFLQQNPGYREGDELCCLAPLSRSNFTPAAQRVIGKAWQIPPCLS